MNFTLTINGETPAELLDALQQLNASPIQSPQSAPVQQPDKPKTQDSCQGQKAHTGARSSPCGGACKPYNGRSLGFSLAGGYRTADSTSASDPATLDKIRELARSLIVAGKRAGVQAAIKATGAASISKLPPDSYTGVWEELLKLKDEVDANASN